MSTLYIIGSISLVVISISAAISRFTYNRGKLTGTSEGWHRGYREATADATERLVTSRKRALGDAGRTTEARPDSIGNARIRTFRISQAQFNADRQDRKPM